MGTLRNPGAFDCLARALPEEPLFVLLARDASAPGMVLQWAFEREREIMRGDRPAEDGAMVLEARRCAQQMADWRVENDGVWRVPLCPP
jgi:hypothetical protein